jgi:hypothetical protein
MNSNAELTPIIDEVLKQREGLSYLDETVTIPCTKPKEAKEKYLGWIKHLSRGEPDPDEIIEEQEYRYLMVSMPSKTKEKGRKAVRAAVGKLKVYFVLFDYSFEKKQIEISMYGAKIKTIFDLKAGIFNDLKSMRYKSRVEKKGLMTGPMRKVFDDLAKIG